MDLLGHIEHRSLECAKPTDDTTPIAMIRLNEKTLNRLDRFPTDDIFGKIIHVSTEPLGLTAYHIVSGRVYSWSFDEVEIIE